MAVKKNIVWFEEVHKDDVGLVGGKGANLGEMTNAQLPIPYGFVLTSHAYFEFIAHNELAPKIKNFLTSVNTDNPHELQQASKEIQSLILNADVPKSISKAVLEYYKNLAMKEEEYISKTSSVVSKFSKTLKHVYRPVPVAVRSSATAEDLPGASFAGQQETYLNVLGETELLKKIQECWASLFTERAIYYRHHQGFDDVKVGLAAVVQRMVQSDKSGIAFSIDPVTNDKFKIVVEAIVGLGEYIVQGKVTPDHYEIDKRSLVITQKDAKYQDLKYVRSGSGNREVKLSKAVGSKLKLTDQEITSVALLVKQIEEHYFFPQDIEWAIEGEKTFIVQSRPITTIKDPNAKKDKVKTTNISEAGATTQTPILMGAPASPGMVTGPVTIIHSPKEIDRIHKGDILVAPQTNPDYVPAMKRAAAIVTEKGGRTSHAAIVSRELGIPAVVGAESATTKLKNGMTITVNGTTGEVFQGSIKGSTSAESLEKEHKALLAEDKHLKTLTKIYINLAEPEQAEELSKRHVDGIGLLRAEFMIAGIGVHPKYLIKHGKQHEFVRKLTHDLIKFVKPFSPRPVIYRATDFKTNEYRNLKGGAEFEPKEENPMLGFRGASRYIADPEEFMLELEAIANIWKMGYCNLHLMIPFIRRPWELIQIKSMIAKAGLFNLPGFRLLIMVEVPAAALELENFLKIGVDGVSIGTNDLTMMLLGVDRDNEHVASVYDERSEAVMGVLEQIVKTCVKYKVSCSICGQAASDYSELVEKLVIAGITSVSVNPDAIERTRKLIFDIEREHFKSLTNKTNS